MRRQRPAKGSGKSPFEHGHNLRFSAGSVELRRGMVDGLINGYASDRDRRLTDWFERERMSSWVSASFPTACHMKNSGLGHNMRAYRSEAMRTMARWRKSSGQGNVLAQGQGGRGSPNWLCWCGRFTIKAGHTIPDGWPTPNRLVLEKRLHGYDNRHGSKAFAASRLFYHFQSTRINKQDDISPFWLNKTLFNMLNGVST